MRELLGDRGSRERAVDDLEGRRTWWNIRAATTPELVRGVVAVERRERQPEELQRVSGAELQAAPRCGRWRPRPVADELQLLTPADDELVDPGRSRSCGRARKGPRSAGRDGGAGKEASGPPRAGCPDSPCSTTPARPPGERIRAELPERPDRTGRDPPAPPPGVTIDPGGAVDALVRGDVTGDESVATRNAWVSRGGRFHFCACCISATPKDSAPRWRRRAR